MNQFDSFKLSKTVAHCVAWFVAVVVFAYLCSYVVDVRIRSIRVPGCQWSVVPDSKNTPYSARFCYLIKEAVLLRVYEGASELVAERYYTYSDLARFYWEPSGLGYISDDREGFIELPPALLDRLRAKLP